MELPIIFQFLGTLHFFFPDDIMRIIHPLQPRALTETAFRDKLDAISF